MRIGRNNSIVSVIMSYIFTIYCLVLSIFKDTSGNRDILVQELQGRQCILEHVMPVATRFEP